MRQIQRTSVFVTAFAGLILLGISGCQSGSPSKRAMAANEPPLNGSANSGFIAEKPAPSSSTAWVDRHPLFNKPKEYYDNSGSNTVVKVAGATLVGIPVGLYGELKQIVVGAPSKAY